VISEDELSFGSDFGRERDDGFSIDAGIPFLEAKENLERQYIKNALAHTQNNKTEAAKMLGISARTLHYKISKYNI
jgi:DNA-binding NtrC family response regulator